MPNSPILFNIGSPEKGIKERKGQLKPVTLKDLLCSSVLVKAGESYASKDKGGQCDGRNDALGETVFCKAKDMLKSGSCLEAVGMFHAVLVLDSGNVKAMNNLAVSYYNLGYFDKAVIYFKKVLKLDPNNEIALKNLEALIESIEIENHNKKREVKDAQIGETCRQ